MQTIWGKKKSQTKQKKKKNSEIERSERRGGKRKHAATGLTSRRVTLSSCMVSERA